MTEKEKMERIRKATSERVITYLVSLIDIGKLDSVLTRVAMVSHVSTVSTVSAVSVSHFTFHKFL